MGLGMQFVRISGRMRRYLPVLCLLLISYITLGGSLPLSELEDPHLNGVSLHLLCEIVEKCKKGCV